MQQSKKFKLVSGKKFEIFHNQKKMLSNFAIKQLKQHISTKVRTQKKFRTVVP